MMTDQSKKDWKKFKEDASVKETQDFEDMLNDLEEDIPKSATDLLEHPSYRELEEKLTLAEQKAQEATDKVLRVMAELENMRRRSELDVNNAHRYALKSFVDGLLPVMDSFEQAIQLENKASDANMIEGLKLTMKLFLDVLEKFGVKQLDPVGEKFNPEEHEAMAMQEAKDVAPNMVLVVFQKGYKLNDRVIRPARVIVSK
jgi:molecular chaperone GrpE